VRYKLELDLSRLPPLQSAGTTGGHWATRVREKKWWTHQIAWHVKVDGAPETPLMRARVTFTRCSPTEPDADNLYASVKYPLDALVSAKVLASDKPSNVDLVCRWEYAKRGQGGLRIKVEEMQ
jgi:hypothetical protein